ncbi:MAG: hypothetical protein ABWZ64_06170 [Xanthobacteraceae bacterium]|jgi:hypothetical protein
MTIRMIAGMISLAALVWAETASAQKTYSLTVSRHRDVRETLSEAEVSRILMKASKMLKKDSSHDDDDDIACNVNFRLSGPVRTFTSAGMAVVDEDNVENVHEVDSDLPGDFHVKLVKEIKFCRPETGRGAFAGCSFSPPDFRSMILVHPKIHRDGNGRPLPDYPDHLLWAHEFGHLTGSGHRHDPAVALMTACDLIGLATITDTCVRVSRAECNRLLSGPGKRPPAAFGQCLLPQPLPSCRAGR